MAIDPTTAPLPFRTLPAAVVVLDQEGAVVDLTDRAADLVGIAPEVVHGCSFLELVAGPARADVDAALTGLLASEGAGRTELHLGIALVDGRGDHVEVDVVATRTPDGAAIGIERRHASADGLLAGMLDVVAATHIDSDVVTGALTQVAISGGWDRASMWLVDDRGGVLRSVASWTRHDDPDDVYGRECRRSSLGQGQGLPGRGWESQDDLVVVDPDASLDGRFRAAPVPAVALAHPIVTGHRTIGVLELLADTPVDATDWIEGPLAAVDPALGHLLERLADRVAVDAAEGSLAMALDAGQFGVATFDRDSGRAQWSPRMADLHGQAAVQGAGPSSALFASVHEDDRSELAMALDRSRVGSSDLETVQYRVRSEAGDLRWLVSRISASSLPGGQVQVAAIASDITEHKQGEQAQSRRAMAVHGLQWVSQALIAGRELDDTAHSLAEAATGVLGATVGAILYTRPGDTDVEPAWAVAGTGPTTEWASAPPSVELPADLEAAMRARTIDLRTDPDVRAWVLSLGLPTDVDPMRSALVVPMRNDAGERFGTMAYLHPDAGYFVDDDVALADAIGRSAAVAIENALRHEQQRQVATTFQRELLPPSEISVEGADVCVRYHPGRAGLDVGGDWYDVIEVGNGRIGLAVGDVCGHGLAAAAHMGQFRYSFRALLQSSIAPGEALAVLNRIALDELSTTVTIVYIELDLDTGACEVWRCGHLPPVVASPDGSAVRWLGDDDHRGPMLGFVDHLDVVGTPDRLEVGELLLLYTDGLVERRGESITDGLARLGRAFRERAEDIGDLCDEVYGLLVEVDTATDDTALLAIRRS